MALATGGAAWGVHALMSAAGDLGTDYGLDTNANAHFDWLVVEAQISLPQAGTWDISADLSNSSPPPSGACGYGAPTPVPILRGAHGFGRGPRRGRARRLPRTPGRGPREPRGSLHLERIPLERRHQCGAAHRVRLSGLRPGDDRHERGLAVPRRSDPSSRRGRSVGLRPHLVLQPYGLRRRQRDAGPDRHDPASSTGLLSGDVVRDDVRVPSGRLR